MFLLVLEQSPVLRPGVSPQRSSLGPLDPKLETELKNVSVPTLPQSRGEQKTLLCKFWAVKNF